MNKNALIDFNGLPCYFSAPNQGATNEQRKKCLLSVDGIPPVARIQKMRSAISRRLQGPPIFMHGSILVHGVCPTGIPRKLARYRSLSPISQKPALSHGDPKPGLKEHAGRCQRKSRLENLRRLCSNSHAQSTNLVCGRAARTGAWRKRVRPGLDDHRPVPVYLCLGSLSKKTRRGQGAYPPQSAGEYSLVCLDHRRKSSRCKDPRHPDPRARLFLYPGPGLPRLRQTLRTASGQGELCGKGQSQYSPSKDLFASCRQKYGTTL